MYDYTPISKLYIRNFRNLGDVEISFKESPIVTLVGENEAGKTSVIKAFATAALHANPRDQKDYIRDGTSMFGVGIELEDGTLITRIKEAKGINSYQIKDSSGKLVWSANKLSEGLPMEVQKLMGLVVEPETNEFLHIRTYEDKLLFVVTPNSTNYKVMYNALKVEQLTNAIKLGSNEANKLKADINANSASIETLGIQMRGINVIDTQPLVNVRNRLKEQLGTLDKIERLRDLVGRTEKCEEQLGAMVLIDKFNLQPINEGTAIRISSAGRLLDNKAIKCNLLSKISDVDNLSEINTSTVSNIEKVIEKIRLLNTKKSEASGLLLLNDLSDISESLIVHLNSAKECNNKCVELSNTLKHYDTTSCNEIEQSDINTINIIFSTMQKINSIENKKDELSKANENIESIHNYMKQCGVAVETCPNCGNDVVFDIDKIGV